MSADARLHFKSPLKKTPFHPRTAAHNVMNHWGPWGGYTTALVFEDEAMEYTAIRNAASVYDLCPMVKYRIKGPDAAAYLNRLTVRNAGKLSVGGVHYTIWCDDAGYVLNEETVVKPPRVLTPTDGRTVSLIPSTPLSAPMTRPTNMLATTCIVRAQHDKPGPTRASHPTPRKWPGSAPPAYLPPSGCSWWAGGGFVLTFGWGGCGRLGGGSGC